MVVVVVAPAPSGEVGEVGEVARPSKVSMSSGVVVFRRPCTSSASIASIAPPWLGVGERARLHCHHAGSGTSGGLVAEQTAVRSSVDRCTHPHLTRGTPHSQYTDLRLSPCNREVHARASRPELESRWILRGLPTLVDPPDLYTLHEVVCRRLREHLGGDPHHAPLHGLSRMHDSPTSKKLRNFQLSE